LEEETMGKTNVRQRATETQPTTTRRKRRSMMEEIRAAAAFEVKTPEFERRKVTSAGDVMRERLKHLEVAIQAFWSERIAVEFAGLRWEDTIRARYPEPLATRLVEWGNLWIRLKKRVARHIDLLTDELQDEATRHREAHLRNAVPSIHERWLRRQLSKVGRRTGGA
jgi:hypothetical protein